MAPLSKVVEPSENIDKSTVKVDFFVAFIGSMSIVGVEYLKSILISAFFID